MSANLDSKVALVTSTAMCSYLGIAAGSAEEEEVDLINNAASTRAAEMSGRGVDENGYSRLLATSRTEYYDGDNSDTLMVRAYPLSSVTSLWIDPDRDYGTDELVDTADYTTYYAQGMVKTDGVPLTSGHKSVKITYTGGYTTVPYDLQLAVKELTMFWYKRNTDKRVGVASVSVGDKSISYEKDMPQSVISVFKRYKDLRNGVG